MAKYSELSEGEKDKVAQKMAKDLNFAFYKQASSDGGFARGTDEKNVALIANEIRKAGIEGASDLVNRISAAKNEQGISYFEQDGGNLRDALISEYSSGDKKDILNAFGYAAHHNLKRTDQELIAEKSKDGVGSSNFSQFSKVDSIDDFPEGVGSWIPNVSETEQGFSEFYDLGFKPMGLIKEDDPEFIGAPNPYKTGGSVTTPKTGTGTATPKPNTDKVDALKAARDKQVRLSGAEGPYGYKGGYDQMVKDQAILKPTRLGQREADPIT